MPPRSDYSRAGLRGSSSMRSPRTPGSARAACSTTFRTKRPWSEAFATGCSRASTRNSSLYQRPIRNGRVPGLALPLFDGHRRRQAGRQFGPVDGGNPVHVGAGLRSSRKSQGTLCSLARETRIGRDRSNDGKARASCRGWAVAFSLVASATDRARAQLECVSSVARHDASLRWSSDREQPPIRLRDRWRRIGRLCARQPDQRGPGPQSSGPRGRTSGRVVGFLIHMPAAFSLGIGHSSCLPPQCPSLGVVPSSYREVHDGSRPTEASASRPPPSSHGLVLDR
jgi:hypothetical protein